jgi:hypothetical protein
MRVFRESQTIKLGNDLLICLKGGDIATFAKIIDGKISDKTIEINNNTTKTGYKPVKCKLVNDVKISEMYKSYKEKS